MSDKILKNVLNTFGLVLLFAAVFLGGAETKANGFELFGMFVLVIAMMITSFFMFMIGREL